MKSDIFTAVIMITTDATVILHVTPCGIAEIYRP
jgi:hypothetical protein